jgi:ketosteroid isomerase-like protein
MSERNVELTRRFIDVWSSRDIEAIIACCDPGIEWNSTFAAVGGAVYHGHDELRSYQRDMEDAWGDDIRLESEAYFDLGEQTLSYLMVRARGQHSRVQVEMPIAAVFRWRDDLLAYFKGYTDREEALRELGVSEDELVEPIEP